MGWSCSTLETRRYPLLGAVPRWLGGQWAQMTGPPPLGGPCRCPPRPRTTSRRGSKWPVRDGRTHPFHSDRRLPGAGPGLELQSPDILVHVQMHCLFINSWEWQNVVALGSSFLVHAMHLISMIPTSVSSTVKSPKLVGHFWYLQWSKIQFWEKESIEQLSIHPPRIRY